MRFLPDLGCVSKTHTYRRCQLFTANRSQIDHNDGSPTQETERCTLRALQKRTEESSISSATLGFLSCLVQIEAQAACSRRLTCLQASKPRFRFSARWDPRQIRGVPARAMSCLLRPIDGNPDVLRSTARRSYDRSRYRVHHPLQLGTRQSRITHRLRERMAQQRERALGEPRRRQQCGAERGT